jgi:hypothetical protein
MCFKDGDGYTFCENIADNLSQEWRWIHIFVRILQIMCIKDSDGYTFCENIADNVSQGQGLEHIMRNIEENVCQVCIWEQIKNRLSQKIGKEG